MKVKLLIYFLLGILFFFITNKKLSEGFLREYIFDININNIYLSQDPMPTSRHNTELGRDRTIELYLSNSDYDSKFPPNNNYNYRFLNMENNIIKNTEFKIDELKNMHIIFDLDNYNDNFIKENFFEEKNTIFIGKKYILSLRSPSIYSNGIPSGPDASIDATSLLEINLNLLYNFDDEDFENKGTPDNPFILVFNIGDPNKIYLIDFDSINNLNILNTTHSYIVKYFLGIDYTRNKDGSFKDDQEQVDAETQKNLFDQKKYPILSPIPFDGGPIVIRANVESNPDLVQGQRSSDLQGDSISTTIDNIELNNIENETIILSKIIRIHNYNRNESYPQMWIPWFTSSLMITIDFKPVINNLYVNKDDIKKYIYFNFIKNITQ